MNVYSAPRSISIVIPVYNEEKNVREIYDRITATSSSFGLPHEVIFVDDGSKDKTYEILKSIQAKDTNVKVVKLAKNYGQVYALLAGFEFIRGDVVITMDGDLQNDPRDIPRFIIKIKQGYDFVGGWRYNRRDSIARKLISKFTNLIIGLRAGRRLHDYGCALIAIRKEIINNLKDYGRTARFIKPLIVRLTDSVCEIKIAHHHRKSGVSKYSFLKISKVGLDFLLNFNSQPKKNDTLPHIIEEVIGN